jgi:glycosyltransferase involved in cell wall biosynthesis
MCDASRNPLVTVAITCCNEKEYIERAVASARFQTYPNIEIVISDAGSVDGTVETLKGMEARKEAKVLFHHTGSATKFDNWEDLIAAAGGEFILLLTAKHILYLNCIEQLIAPHLTDSRFGYVRACMVWRHADGVKQAMVPAMFSGKQSSEKELKRLFKGNVSETISTLYRVETLRNALPIDRRLGRSFMWKINAIVAQAGPVFFLNVDVAEWFAEARRDVVISKTQELSKELVLLYDELGRLAVSSGLKINVEKFRKNMVARNALVSELSDVHHKSWRSHLMSFLRQMIFRFGRKPIF